MTALFILNSVSDRPYTDCRRLAREQVISETRAYKGLMHKNKLNQKRSGDIRQIQILLKMRNLPKKWYAEGGRMNNEEIFERVYTLEEFDAGRNVPY